MSCCIVAVSHAQGIAHVLTDTLAYTSDRRLWRTTSKVRTFPHAGQQSGCVAAGRGNAGIVSKALLALEGCVSFDEMCDRLLDPKLVPWYWRALAALLSHPSFRPLHIGILGIEITVAGYSDRLGHMAAAVISNHPDAAAGLQFSEILISPAVDAALLRRLPDNPNDWPSAMASWAMKQRDLWKLGGSDMPPIGGAVVLTSVSRNQITQKVILRFDDALAAPEASPQ